MQIILIKKIIKNETAIVTSEEVTDIDTEKLTDAEYYFCSKEIYDKWRKSIIKLVKSGKDKKLENMYVNKVKGE